MTTQAYIDKLKDPRWQKKRLEIMANDNWACTLCGDTASELMVHHKDYISNTNPWDYPDNLLTTLCSTCHQKETYDRAKTEQQLLHLLREHFDNDSLVLLIKRITYCIAHKPSAINIIIK
jgi:5-methylcytosine-specific restriction endonuclease McrA